MSVPPAYCHNSLYRYIARCFVFHTRFDNINILLFENGILNVACKLERVDVPTHETGLYTSNLISSSFERNRIVKKIYTNLKIKPSYFYGKNTNKFEETF